MKTLALLALLVPTLLNAAIWRVNNNPDYDPDFTSLQDAINAANAGDTIHVEPSPDSYGTNTLNKQLTLIGPGFKLGQGGGNNSGLQANSQTAKIELLLLMDGAEGSHMTGLHFLPSGGVQFEDGAGDFVISRCYFEQGSVSFNNLALLSQVLITQCYFNGSGIGLLAGADGVQSGISITNSYINGPIQADPLYASDWVVTHNVFDGPFPIALYDAEISDNVFNETALLEVNDNSIHHNLMASLDGTLPTGPGLENHDGLDIANVCVLAGSDDARWHLTPNALSTYPASDDTERGMYGGATPYKPSGVPSVPSIHILQSPPTAVQGATIDVSIGTRSND